MRTRLSLLFLTASFPFLAQAQKGDLSVGLNTLYFPNNVAGLGASLDYRWHLGKRTEVMGLFSHTLFFAFGHRADLNRSNGADEEIWDQSIQAGGLGFGYRFGKEGNGFHLGLLAGGVAYKGTDLDWKEKRLIAPAIGLTMGHPLCDRFDVSLDAWLLRSVKDELLPYPLLRFSFSLWRKN